MQHFDLKIYLTLHWFSSKCLGVFPDGITKIGLNSPNEFKTCIARVEVNLIVFNGFSELFNSNIISCLAFSIHLYFDAFILKIVRPHKTGVL